MTGLSGRGLPATFTPASPLLVAETGRFRRHLPSRNRGERLQWPQSSIPLAFPTYGVTVMAKGNNSQNKDKKKAKANPKDKAKDADKAKPAPPKKKS